MKTNKTYYEQHGIGRTKYSVSFHDGVKTHPDGSKFFDIRLFKNKPSLVAFIATLKNSGYTLGPRYDNGRLLK